jgi:hypothetical protein
MVTCDRVIVNNELGDKYRRNRSWPGSKYYLGIWPEVLRNSRYWGRDLNPGSPEYEAGMLPIRSRHVVILTESYTLAGQLNPVVYSVDGHFILSCPPVVM